MPQKIKRRSDPCGVSDYKGILSCCNARKQAAQRPLFSQFGCYLQEMYMISPLSFLPIL
jgi:hypothetical protein